tara:strand:- start:1158 stop:1337 length:180 start_codon:yes stop_codon:yes gene_type:complete
MSKHFELLDEEIAVSKAVGAEHLEIMNRLVLFVNTRLDEIELIQTDLAKAQQDITDLKT